MHRYKLIEIRAGATLEIIKCIPRGCRKGVKRSQIKKTKEEIAKANMRQAVRKLARKINANFMPGDWHVTLTYKRGEVPADYLIKETDETFREKNTPFHQRYSCSRNLVEPKVEKRTVEAKEWVMDPKPRKGYYILQDSLYNGYDRMGYRYQRYVMVKLNPTPEDWIQGGG